MLGLIALILAAVSPLAAAERVRCTVSADTWVEAPPFSRTAAPAAVENHGADTQLVINGRNAFALLQFDLSAARGMKIEKATAIDSYSVLEQDRQLAWAQGLYQIGQTITQEKSERVQQKLLEHIVTFFEADSGCIALLGPCVFVRDDSAVVTR